MGNANTVPPDALLLLTSQCPHCPTVPLSRKDWAERAASADGLVLYYAELLKQGQLARVLSAIHRHSICACLTSNISPGLEIWSDSPMCGYGTHGFFQENGFK